jgi:hypothetical protein
MAGCLLPLLLVAVLPAVQASQPRVPIGEWRPWTGRRRLSRNYTSVRGWGGGRGARRAVSSRLRQIYAPRSLELTAGRSVCLSVCWKSNPGVRGYSYCPRKGPQGALRKLSVSCLQSS